MRLPLALASETADMVILRAILAASEVALGLRYRAPVGALLRIDGIPAGAFDREHDVVVVAPSDRSRECELVVERHGLPTNGLPSGGGVRWRWLEWRSSPRPAVQAELDDPPQLPPRTGGDVEAIGHSHLDVAWLWTFEETRRKAARTFAIACDLLERDETFVFVQSQPQLYAYVERDEPALFDRVARHVAGGRFDPDVAALWVESDCNIPSGESLLRQMLYAYEYCRNRFGRAPSIAWLPDSFGFSATLPTLLAHAGIRRFMTTKLQWNDTTRFPHAQFRWRGPDGSELVCALIDAYDGGLDPRRVGVARARNEPVVAGYGDGGGGVTETMLAQVRESGRWIHPAQWFERLEERSDLPVHVDELYLEYHRGVFTTHHDMKAHNALLERALQHAEELLAWCVAVRGSREAVRRCVAMLHGAWEILLRNQFHDVLTGTSIAEVHEEALRDYARAEELVWNALETAHQTLPRATPRLAQARRSPPVPDDHGYRFDNGLIQAVVRSDGGLVELRVPGGANVVTQANLLAVYEDRPRQWDAWNIDTSYAKRMRAARPLQNAIEDDELVVHFELARDRSGTSTAIMRVAAFEGEPFLRVRLEVDWHVAHRLLRVENWLPLEAAEILYGAPHGVVSRPSLARTPAERAKFEVPGQRFALVAGGEGDALALLALDSYGWSGQSLPRGGVRLGHSLLRATRWPDPKADVGEHVLAYAFAPLTQATIGVLERYWQAFADEPRVRLFTCDDAAVLVVACKPAHDEDGVIVRVRECDGRPRSVRLRCAARMREAASVDGLERAHERAVAIEGEELVFDLAPFALRAFRVRFSG